jgi:hypothetical protein
MSTDQVPGFIDTITSSATFVSRKLTDSFGVIFDDNGNNDNTLSQSQYNFNYRTFPEDIANDYIGHYMVININVPVTRTGTLAQRSEYGGPGFGQTLLRNESSKVDALRFGNAVNVDRPGTTTPPPRQEIFSIPRFTRRIAESIAIFMPTPMIYNTTNEHQEISLTALAAGMVSSGFDFAASRVGGRAGQRIGATGNLLNSAGRLAGQISGLARAPINPRVEVIFSRTNLRQFRFEFLMAPRNEKESQNLQAIISTLRFHSVPELSSATNGFTFIPPAEFDFTFYNKGLENLYVPRINTCVMDQIEVDYAPTGVYSTFTSGHPVMVRLSMGVREVEILHKRRVLQGF